MAGVIAPGARRRTRRVPAAPLFAAAGASGSAPHPARRAARPACSPPRPVRSG